MVDIRQSLDYVSAECVKERVMRFLVKDHCNKIRLVVLNGEDVHSLDYTVANVSFILGVSGS